MTVLTTGPSSHESELRYEELRAGVLDGSSGPALGLAILLRRGMVAWLQALESCVNGAPEKFPAATQSPVMLPANTRGEIVRILAGIALGSARCERI